jgi:hypothetical protein
MINPFKEVNWNPDRGDLRKFSRSLMMGFPLMAGAVLLMGRLTSGGWKWHQAGTLAGMGVALGAVLWVVPLLARPFYFGWYFFACCMGLITGNLLLAIIYCLFFTGLGLLSRIFGRIAIRKTLDRTAPTYWRSARPNRDLRRYYDQF